jgi:hypothetical protein
MYQIDETIEISISQYNKAMNLLSGIIAGRQENGKNYIKIMCFSDYANNLLKTIL